MGVIARRGCLSLRAICEEIWPDERWRPLFPGEDSMAEGRPGETPRAQKVWEHLGRLLSADLIRVAGRDPDEVDSLAAVAFELVGRRRAARS